MSSVRRVVAVLALAGCEFVRAPDGGSYACGSNADCRGNERCSSGLCVVGGAGGGGGTGGGAAGGAAAGGGATAGGAAAGGAAGGAPIDPGAPCGTVDAGLPNCMFVTPARYDGGLMGRDGADEICQRHAGSAGLTGTYRAWLSVSGPDGGAAARFGGARGWVRVDGRPVADTVADLTAGRLFYPPLLSELGARGGAAAWTGSTRAGQASAATCNDWQPGAASPAGTLGRPQNTRDWSFNPVTAGSSCDQLAGLYCLGVDRAQAVAPPPAPGTARRAFVTEAAYPSGGGVAAFDSACEAEADDAGLTGAFLALVAPAAGVAAASRFDLDGGPWARVDGVLLAFSAGGFGTASMLTDATLSVTARGHHHPDAGDAVWTGASSPTSGGVHTCAGWTSTSDAGTVLGTIGSAHDLQNGFSGPSQACHLPRGLYCLQQ